MSQNVTKEIDLILDSDRIPMFFPFLQKGVGLRVQVGCSVRELISGQFGLSPEYLEDRIQTLFLDGQPVDDLDSAIIQDGSVLALSAAMPGLAGATLRRGGFFAPMRSQISFRGKKKGDSSREGMITLKLFNLLIRELGTFLLNQGVWLKGHELEQFFANQPAGFWKGCRRRWPRRTQ